MYSRSVPSSGEVCTFIYFALKFHTFVSVCVCFLWVCMYIVYVCVQVYFCIPLYWYVPYVSSMYIMYVLTVPCADHLIEPKVSTSEKQQLVV